MAQLLKEQSIFLRLCGGAIPPVRRLCLLQTIVLLVILATCTANALPVTDTPESNNAAPVLAAPHEGLGEHPAHGSPARRDGGAGGSLTVLLRGRFFGEPLPLVGLASTSVSIGTGAAPSNPAGTVGATSPSTTEPNPSAGDSLVSSGAIGSPTMGSTSSESVPVSEAEADHADAETPPTGGLSSSAIGGQNSGADSMVVVTNADGSFVVVYRTSSSRPLQPTGRYVVRGVR